MSKKRQPPAPPNEPEVVNTHDAALIVGLSAATLASLRSRGGGPPYKKLGRSVRYEVDALRAWRDARTLTHTGAEPEPPT